MLVEIGSDAILVEAMKDRTSGEMVRAYQVLVDRLSIYGVVPKHHVLDHACSAEFKDAIKSINMKYQLVDTY